MSFSQVTWTSKTRLSCSGCLPADIVLCIPSTKIAQKSCPISPSVAPQTTSNTSFTWNTIEATLTVAVPLTDSCGQTFWKYVAQYDNSLLIAGASIAGTDITSAFCKGCMAQWIEDLVGNDVMVQNVVGPPAGLLLTNQHGCQFFLAEVTGASLASGVWGETPGLVLPGCAIESGGLIYVDDRGQFRSAPVAPSGFSGRADAGNFDSGVGVVPADGTVGNLITIPFTNPGCLPMTVMPIVENPSVVFNMGATNDWEVGLVITPSWIASNSPQIARFSSSGAANITFPSGMTSFPGAVVVAGGATITMTVQWVFNRPVYNSNGANRVQIYGPRGYFIGLQG